MLGDSRQINSPATFLQASARFNIRHALAGDQHVGSVPEVVDREGDSLIYSLAGPESIRFTIDQSGEIRTAAGETDFTGGDDYSLTVSVSDGKQGLDSSDDRIDHSINLTIHVYHNADPVFDTADGTIITVAEDITESDVIARIDASDADDDSLEEVALGDQTLPFEFENDEIKLKTGGILDYELQTHTRSL